MPDEVKKEAIKYCQTIDEFMENNPTIDPAFKDFIKPVVGRADDRIYNLVMGSIFS